MFTTITSRLWWLSMIDLCTHDIALSRLRQTRLCCGQSIEILVHKHPWELVLPQPPRRYKQSQPKKREVGTLRAEVQQAGSCSFSRHVTELLRPSLETNGVLTILQLIGVLAFIAFAVAAVVSCPSTIERTLTAFYREHTTRRRSRSEHGSSVICNDA